MNAILKKLEGGDRRSIGRSNEVVAEVLADPRKFRVLFEGMLIDDPLIRMRAADAVEKITAKHPEYLLPFKTKLINKIAKIEQQEVRWHAAQMFSRIRLNEKERQAVIEVLEDYLADKSSIVRTFAMQALADLALQDARLRPAILTRLEELTRTGSPAMKSRGKKLLSRLKRG
jgi:HEAT repeat protein